MRESADPPSGNPAGLSDHERGLMTVGGLDHLHEAISIFDQALRLVVWNRRFAELLDFPSNLLRVGLPFAELIGYNARRGEYGPGDPDAQTAERVGLAQLPPPLRAAAEARLAHPDATLAELAALLGIGRSGANHRLRKLSELAAGKN